MTIFFYFESVIHWSRHGCWHGRGWCGGWCGGWSTWWGWVNGRWLFVMPYEKKSWNSSYAINYLNANDSFSNSGWSTYSEIFLFVNYGDILHIAVDLARWGLGSDLRRNFIYCVSELYHYPTIHINRISEDKTCWWCWCRARRAHLNIYFYLAGK